MTLLLKFLNSDLKVRLLLILLFPVVLQVLRVTTESEGSQSPL